MDTLHCKTKKKPFTARSFDSCFLKSWSNPNLVENTAVNVWCLGYDTLKSTLEEPWSKQLTFQRREGNDSTMSWDPEALQHYSIYKAIIGPITRCKLTHGLKVYWPADVLKAWNTLRLFTPWSPALWFGVIGVGRWSEMRYPSSKIFNYRCHPCDWRPAAPGCHGNIPDNCKYFNINISWLLNIITRHTSSQYSVCRPDTGRGWEMPG